MDPLAVLALVADVRRALWALERTAAVAARRSGSSWRDLGRALGVSHQAAHGRFRAVDPRPRRERDPEDAELEQIARRFAGGGRHPELTGCGPVKGG